MNERPLSPLQLDVMKVLWHLGEASVSEVQADLESDRTLATTTVATLLSRLQRRGLVSHRREGRQYIYRAQVTEEEVRRSMVGELADSLFRGDVTSLVCHLLSERDISAGDLTRIRTLIESKERDPQG